MATGSVMYYLLYDHFFSVPFLPPPLRAGLRKQIFNGTWWDEETDDYVMETGISVREYQMCDREITSRAATNMKGYEKVPGICSYFGDVRFFCSEKGTKASSKRNQQ